MTHQITPEELEDLTLCFWCHEMMEDPEEQEDFDMFCSDRCRSYTLRWARTFVMAGGLKKGLI